ncbi:unnamed protein product, partial [Mesorhabditis belari]|uniref:Peptidase M28 domain-containing protein n=1 Tax=Mesorhabditis belari TaxID=2138241 RepID=A0AAF3E8K6_9BILA
MKHDLSKFLSIPRFTIDEKKRAREEISKAFGGIGLSAMTHSFISEEDSTSLGHNVISIQAGPHYGTMNDEVVIVAANYDTLDDLPGVDDNGSGVAAVLETARTMATLDRLYPRRFTIIYALFDMKHQGLAGSHAFVSDVVLPILQNTNATIGAVIILDGLAHFDPFPTTQTMPPGFEKFFPGAARELSLHNHMGDFVQVTARAGIDDPLLQNFVAAFTRATSMIAPDWSFRPWLLPLKIALHEVRSMEGLRALHPFLYADHSSFYFHNQRNLDVPTIYITDTLSNRGVKQYCTYCDGLYMINEQNLRFLSLMTDTVIRSVVQISQSEAAGIVDEMFLTFGFGAQALRKKL